MLISHWGNISQNIRVNKSKKKGGGKMIRSKQKKRRNSLNFGEIEGAKRIAVTKTRGQAKAAGKTVKAVILLASALQAISTIIEAIAKIIRSFISQCKIKSHCDFFYRFVMDGSYLNGWQKKYICSTPLSCA